MGDRITPGKCRVEISRCFIDINNDWVVGGWRMKVGVGFITYDTPKVSRCKTEYDTLSVE